MKYFQNLPQLNFKKFLENFRTFSSPSATLVLIKVKKNHKWSPECSHFAAKQFKEERAGMMATVKTSQLDCEISRVAEVMAQAAGFTGSHRPQSHIIQKHATAALHSLPWLIILSSSILPRLAPPDLQVVLYLNVRVDFSRKKCSSLLSSLKSQLGPEQKSKGKQCSQMNSWTTAYSFCLSGEHNAAVAGYINLLFYCKERNNTSEWISWIFIYVCVFCAAALPSWQTPDFIYLSAQTPKNHASLTITLPSPSIHRSFSFFFFFLFSPHSPPSVSCPSLLLLCTAKHHYWSFPKHKLKIYPVVICCTVPSIIGGAWQRLRTREEVLEQEAESRTFTRNKKLVTIIYGSCWDT